MMKCVTLMTDMEDESNGIALEMMDLVDDECVEHVFLDFMHMELGMEEVRVEPGEGVWFRRYSFRMSRVR